MIFSRSEAKNVSASILAISTDSAEAIFSTFQSSFISKILF
jgi:hypothetical protein